MPPRNAKFQLQALATGALIFILGTVAFLPRAEARDLATDPNALQKIQQFIYKPAPSELLLKPKGEIGKPSKKPAKGAKN